jgi:hypothetical protein
VTAVGAKIPLVFIAAGKTGAPSKGKSETLRVIGERTQEVVGKHPTHFKIISRNFV